MRDDPKRYACITLAYVPAPYKSSPLSRFYLILGLSVISAAQLWFWSMGEGLRFF